MYIQESKEMRPLNYERYRILIQNGFLKIKEEKFLKTLALEEKYGGKTYQTQKAEDDIVGINPKLTDIGWNVTSCVMYLNLSEPQQTPPK